MVKSVIKAAAGALPDHISTGARRDPVDDIPLDQRKTVTTAPVNDIVVTTYVDVVADHQ